ncbi:unnamed protein product [Phaeothamnion confervicola]
MPSPELINQSVPLPEEKIGWVIGKNGSYVQQLAVKSGATLRVSDSSSYEYGRTWKYVQISGPPRAVDRAKKLLHIRLERLADRPTDSAAAQQVCALCWLLFPLFAGGLWWRVSRPLRHRIEQQPKLEQLVRRKSETSQSTVLTHRSGVPSFAACRRLI